jgi:hypothetical protein
MRDPHGNGSRPPRSFHGQLTMPPCRLQGPRGPVSSGPTWFSRRPSLSQQPAGSQWVTWTGRWAGGGDTGGAGSGTRVGGAARICGGGTACAGWGDPARLRSGPGRKVPRHSREASRRARANWLALSAVPSAPLRVPSSSARAWRHRTESMGSPANAAVLNTAAASSKKQRGLRMRFASRAGAAGFAALSDRFRTGLCLR